MAHFEQAISLTGSARLAIVVVLDMAAAVLMVRPTSAKTFADYATQHIVPFLEYQITTTVERIDAIWDNYPEGNLKHSRISIVVLVYGLGLGMATLKYQSTTGTVDSLKNEENKKELFSFLSEEIVKKDLGRKLPQSTKCERVLSNRPCGVSALEPSNHSEADTMIFRHLAHASGKGHQTAYMFEQLIVIS